ncbi:tripartite tricarboxylate transporter TctB family protein [Klenkia brasiliensis]|uniref:Putative tricarboxylic transport membrane protein n=1 Tax=Klenkia brasiliensis TaxID=333142 RepID=A0A1G7XF47_9ACTN|nr:tripartite tricarboxylate transporter TctB family protein [Klenkia brasiliensis]SDG82878.1 putative tricarboxylic transport membrane protein [Klenkia brasiliensis]
MNESEESVAAEVAPQPRTGFPGELVGAVLLAALGVYLLVDAGAIAIPNSSNTIGPRFFPYAVGGLTLATGALLAIRVLRGDRGPADDSEDVDLTAPTDWRAVAVIAVAFAAHALLINVVGWPLAVALMFAAVAWALGAVGVVRPFLVGLVVGCVVWIVFVKALSVALPGGVVLEFLTSWF